MSVKLKFTQYINLPLWLILLSGAFTTHAQQPILYQDSLQATLTLSELLIRAQELNRTTQTTILQLQDTTELHSFREATNTFVQHVNDLKAESELFLKSYTRKWLIRNLHAKWILEDNISLKLTTQLTEAIQKNEKELILVRDLTKTWTTTRSDVLSNTLGEILRKPTGELLINLRQEERLLLQKIKDYLRLQEKVTTGRSTVTTYLDYIKPYLNQDFLSLLRRDESFIWNRQSSADTARLSSQLYKSYQLSSQDAGAYLLLNAGRLVLILFIAVIIIVIIRSAKQVSDQHVEEDIKEPVSDKPLKNVGVYTYTVSIMLMLAILPDRPPLLTEALLLLFTYPLIVLVVRKAEGAIRYCTIGFLVLYWSYALTDFLIIDNLLTSYIDLAHSILASVILLILFYKRQVFRSQFPELYELQKSSLIPILFILTSLAVILQITGFSLLARALTSGAISYGYLAPVILISAVISRNIFIELEKTTFVKNSVLAQKYYHFIYAGIKLVALYLLFVTLVSVYSLRSTILALLQELWNFGGQFGEFTLTLGGVVEFFLIIVVAVAISGILQVLLEGEILSRFNLKRGVGMAIGVIARYSIVVLGFFMAVASTGFDLTKISIIAGAVGVGIGFGLQNLVANFIAGLILIFERPFVVNDTIESEQVEGTVQEIGIRASKILTYDGAEVIIPNSNLISNRVSNWTLTNNARRQIITIRTSVQADPDDVIKILLQIVNRHEYTLNMPEPYVVFDGQVEQSLQFRLYYWLVSEMLKTRSEINLQIYRELKTMGVELPVPVYEIKSMQKE